MRDRPCVPRPTVFIRASAATSLHPRHRSAVLRWPSPLTCTGRGPDGRGRPLPPRARVTHCRRPVCSALVGRGRHWRCRPSRRATDGQHRMDGRPPRWSTARRPAREVGAPPAAPHGRPAGPAESTAAAPLRAVDGRRWGTTLVVSWKRMRRCRWEGWSVRRRRPVRPGVCALRLQGQSGSPSRGLWPRAATPSAAARRRRHHGLPQPPPTGEHCSQTPPANRLAYPHSRTPPPRGLVPPLTAAASRSHRQIVCFCRLACLSANQIPWPSGQGALKV